MSRTVVLVTGGRDYEDRDHVFTSLDLVNLSVRIDMIIEGGAEGADRFAREWAKSRGVHYATVPALWDVYGKGAGFRRNSAMLVLQPTDVFAFPGGKGTHMMKDLAEKAGIPVTEF